MFHPGQELPQSKRLNAAFVSKDTTFFWETGNPLWEQKFVIF